MPSNEISESALAARSRRRQTAVLVLVIGLASLAWAIYPGQLAAWITAIAAAWIAAFRVGCDKIGVALWAIAAGFLSWPLCIVATNGTSDELLHRGPNGVFLAPVLLVVATIRLLWVRRKTASARGPNAAMLVVVLFTLLIPATVGSMIANVKHDQAEYHKTTQMLVGLHRVAADVEAFRNARGTLPNDEEELVAWRGSPMPSGEYYGVHYDKLDGDQYNLRAGVQHFWGHAWDLFGYIITSGGPRSAERLHVELF